MKKMFTLLVSLVTFSALFAQYDKSYDNHRNDDRNLSQNDSRFNNNDRGYQSGDQRYNNNGGGNYNDTRHNNNDANYRPDHAVDMRRDDDRWRHDDRGRQYDRDQYHDDYDRHSGVGYRSNTNLYPYANGGVVYEREHRDLRLKAIGGAVLVAGILGAVIGSHL